MSLCIKPSITNIKSCAKKPNAMRSNRSNAGVVIIGAGMAGSRFAIELARAQQQSDPLTSAGLESIEAPLPITLISKEPQVGYNRIMLSPVLAGDTAFNDTYLYSVSDYEQLGITVLAGVTVDSINTEQQFIKLQQGQTLPYAKLVIATGSTARVIPFDNHKALGVHVFRDLADVTALTRYAHQNKTGIVIGGGVLGLEAACALTTQGAHMTVVHVDNYVLNRQLDEPAAKLLQAELSRRSIGLELAASTESIVINNNNSNDDNNANKVCGLALKDGRTLPADFIVMAVGVIPNTTLAKDNGLVVNRGIIVDRYMHTSCQDVYAIGECVELDGELFGMVTPINQQVDTLVSVLKSPKISNASPLSAAKVLSDHKLWVPDSWQPFVSKPLSLKLKVSGIAAFSAGQIEFDEEEQQAIETITYYQRSLNHYHCLYCKGDKLVGAVLYGDVDEGPFYSQLISEGSDISLIKQYLIFGAAYCHLDPVDTDMIVSNELDLDTGSSNNTCNDNHAINRNSHQEDALQDQAVQKNALKATGSLGEVS